MVHPYPIGRVFRQCAEPLDPEPARQTAPRPTARSKGIVRSNRTDPHPDGPSHPTVSVGRLALRFPVPKTAACDVSTLNLHLWRPMICKLTWVVCASPMPRTSVPPISLLWDPNTCSTRARTFERVLLPRFSHSLKGLLRGPLRWIRLFSPCSPTAPRLPPNDRRCPPTPPTPCCRRSGAPQNWAGMHRGIRYPIAPHQLVPPIHVHVVLVAAMTLAVLLGPARVRVLLRPFGRRPVVRRFPRLDPRVLLAPVALLGNRHD